MTGWEYRPCQACGQQLKRRTGEQSRHYRRRLHCDAACAETRPLTEPQRAYLREFDQWLGDPLSDWPALDRRSATLAVVLIEARSGQEA